MRRFSAVAALALACRGPVPAARPETAARCEPPSGALGPAASAASLGGSYRLELIATRGARAGAATEGSLRLAPRVDSLQRPVPMLGLEDTTTRLPLAGEADFNAAAVGAVSPGQLRSTDPLAPGVLVIERRGSSTEAPLIMLRLGSEANRRGVVRFDGGYLALTVQQIEPQGFAGTWRSGGVSASESAGHFCAVRMDTAR